MGAGYGEQMINARILERAADGNGNSSSLAQEESLKNRSFGRNSAWIGPELRFDLFLEVLSDYRDDPERRVWFSWFKRLQKQGAFGVCPVVDLLDLEISILGWGIEILVPF